MLRAPDPDIATIIADPSGNGKRHACLIAQRALSTCSRVLLALFLTSASGAVADPVGPVLPPDSIIADRDLAWYAQDWWQWAFSMPTDQSPIRDTDGRLCGVNQDGSVWYLAGGFGTARIHRSCTVPAGRFLFFPIINTVVTTAPGQARTCEEVRTEAARNNDRYVHLMVEIDGVRIPDLQQTRIAPTTCFDLAGRASPDLKPRPFYPTATDGFWVMLPPLPPGDHRLEFRAFYTNEVAPWGDAVQNISYDLVIE
jgi:hypothetical protein